jgi:drug/metabolite transporter (DMT)-like permease
MSFPSALGLALLGIVLTATAQLLLKAGATRSHGRHALRLWANRQVILGYGVFFLVTLLNLAAYRVLPLKMGVVLSPLMLLLVVAGSRVFFHEKIHRSTLAGLALILVGVVVFNWPTGPEQTGDRVSQLGVREATPLRGANPNPP